MTFLFSLALLSLAGLVTYNVIVYFHTTGTVTERLSAAWKGSMTLFGLIWATIATLLANGMDAISTITGDPKFAQVGDAVKAAVPAHWGQWVVVATLALPLIAGGFGRLRTLNKGA